MHGVWQQCWLAKASKYGWQPFRSVGDPVGLHISFHWAALAKTYKQLWRRLRSHNIECCTRGGRIRISLAPYNDESDVNAVSEALAGADS